MCIRDSAYVDTKQLSGQFIGKELPLAAHHQLSQRVNYRSGKWNWNVNGQYQSSLFSDGANSVTENASGSIGPIPAFAVWNTKVTYQTRLQGKKITAGLGINNLLDKNYYFRGVDFSQGRMPSPRRSALMSLQIDI